MILELRELIGVDHIFLPRITRMQSIGIQRIFFDDLADFLRMKLTNNV